MRWMIPVAALVLFAAGCGDDPKPAADVAKAPPAKPPVTAVEPEAPAKPADPKPAIETPPAKPDSTPVPAPVPPPAAPKPQPEPPTVPAPKPPVVPVPPVAPTPPTPPVAPAPPVAPVPPVAPPVAPPSTSGAEADAAPKWTDTFVGGDACKKCHFQEAKAWGKTTLAKSLDALRPTAADDAVRFERKRKAGLDPARDYSADQTCLPCHVTGFGSEGGYPAPDSPAASDAARTKRMGSIACEACHGPGARYVPFKLAALAADTNAKFDEKVLATYGLTRPTEAVCRMCHNEKSPTHAGDTFDWTNDRVRVHPKK
ncbi:MAG: hypothetical protein K8T90_22630 [Planctomycetes bacterium]|nr:hypothetical protein [Planctomycetota bacterium]